MAIVKPFYCLRPCSEKAQRVASVPYDVVDTAEARALASGNPDSFLHIVRSEIDLPDGTDPYSPEVYALARRNLESFIKQGTLIADPEPSFYIYQLKMGSHTQTGVVGCSAVADYDQGIIRIHEQTRQDKEDDRVRHVLETATHSEPVFLTFFNTSELATLIANETTEQSLYNFTAIDGVTHTLWKAKDNKQLERAFSRVPYTYVADGHHRAKSASRVCQTLLQKFPGLPNSHPARFFLTVLFPHSQMQILPYNRVIKKSPLAIPDLMQKISASFIISTNAAPVPAQRGHFSMFLEGTWYKLELRRNLPIPSDPVESLDVSILQRHLFEPVFGITDPRRSQNLAFVGGIRGTAELERLVKEGSAQIAFSLYPVPVVDFLKVAEAGQLMPPKSTWFEPKLRSGLFVHTFNV